VYKYYLNSSLGGMYSGASMIIHNPHENELEHSTRGSRRRGSTRRTSQRRNNYNRRTRNNRGNTRRSIISQRGGEGGITDSDFSRLNKKQLSKLKEASEKENKFFNIRFFKKFKRNNNK